ncbi:MAG TPA: hypothetical protein VMN57_05475 [Anaerolineales bacterium]|nr:hypothetical protein [Anaerolineales bacterium]
MADQTKRHRSPNYPYYDLEECVGFLEKIYAKNGFSEIHFDFAVEHAGHSATSSTANRVISSLISFGLIDVHGSGKAKFVKISHLGKRIVLEKDPDSPEKIQALGEAAESDSIVQKVLDYFPIKQESLEKKLVLDLEFSKVGARRFSKVMVNTYEYARFSEEVIMSSNESDKLVADEDAVFEDSPESKFSRTERSDLPKDSQTYNLSLGNEKELIAIKSGDWTEEDFEFMISWLNRLRKDFLTNGNK